MSGKYVLMQKTGFESIYFARSLRINIYSRDSLFLRKRLWVGVTYSSKDWSHESWTSFFRWVSVRLVLAALLREVYIVALPYS